MLQLPGIWTACAQVSLQGQGQGIREGHRQGEGKGHEHLRADPQQCEGQGEIQRADVWNLLDMRRRALRGELPQGQGQGPQPSGGTGGLRPVGARGVGEPGDPHPIAHPGADARPGAGGRERGGLDVEVKKAKKEKAQESRIIRTIEPETVNSVTTKNKWAVIDLAVDSGASETVISEDMLPNIPIKQEDASRRGGAVRGCQRRAHPEPR